MVLCLPVLPGIQLMHLGCCGVSISRDLRFIIFFNLSELH